MLSYGGGRPRLPDIRQHSRRDRECLRACPSLISLEIFGNTSFSISANSSHPTTAASWLLRSVFFVLPLFQQLNAAPLAAQHRIGYTKPLSAFYPQCQMLKLVDGLLFELCSTTSQPVFQEGDWKFGLSVTVNGRELSSDYAFT